jgi:D-beta-D-heptose 7-phosphate kinase/D-beta-D-heptose 1-phosphate adenosyltransferase
MTKIIALSGGFDPVHCGHLDMINAAAKLRKKILMNFKNVHNVVAVDDSDGTVCEALKRFRPEYFGNGGDRTTKNTPEKDVCNELGIEMVWGLGGGKSQSSSKLVYEASEAKRDWLIEIK